MGEVLGALILPECNTYWQSHSSSFLLHFPASLQGFIIMHSTSLLDLKMKRRPIPVVCSFAPRRFLFSAKWKRWLPPLEKNIEIREHLEKYFCRCNWEKKQFSIQFQQVTVVTTVSVAVFHEALRNLLSS